MRSPTPLLVLLLCSLPAVAQETRGMIFGTVYDPQGAAVPGASVVVRNTDSNTNSRLTTNGAGYFEANLLLPGAYEVSAESAGFRQLIRRGIVLSVSARLEVNLKLEVGNVSESVSVVADAPLLDTNAVSSGRTLDNRSLMDLPVMSNNPTLLAKFSPGVSSGGTTPYLPLHSTIGGSEYTNSTGVGGNEYSIDGVPNDGNSRRVAYLPYSDTVQEVKIETSNFDASIGHTTGINVTMISKSGTNQPHGTATWQHWQQRWNGTAFFVKQLYYRNIAAAEAAGDKALADSLRSQDKQPSGRSNNYAATFGGPVVVPHLVNGRNKLFFFMSFNGFKDRITEQANRITKTIPTLDARNGDFSSLLRVDASRYQIYDPLTVRADSARATHYVRDPIPGNILPKSRMNNPVAAAYTKLLPTPNSDPTNPAIEPTGNYLAAGTPYNSDYKAWSNRMDYNQSEKSRFFFRWSWNDFLQDRLDWTYESARGLHTDGLNRHNFGGTLDWVYTQSATTLFDFAIAANEYSEGHRLTTPLTYKPSDVGFPTYMDAKAGSQTTLPVMNFGGYETIGQDYPDFARYRMLTGKATVTHVRAKHTLTAGFDVRQHFRTGTGTSNTSGSYTFDNTYTRRYDDTLQPAGSLGHSWAAFLMGIPSAMTVATTDNFAMQSPYYAWFAQDSWRLTPRITLNFGLRAEFEQGATERYNRMIAGFDPAAKLPISDAVQAAYARAPLAELAASNFKVVGGSLYPAVDGRSRRLYQNELMWLPRFSAAWQVSDKTVLRAGYGIFYDTLNVLNFGPDQTGYSRSTSTVLTNDFGVNWNAGNPRAGVSPLTDPFPLRADGTRFDSPTRDALGVMARAGRGFSFTDFDRKHARQQRWRIGVQRQFGSRMVLEAAYAGSYSDRVSITQSLSPLPEQYWASGNVRNNAIDTDLNSNVTNPFRITNLADLRTTNPLVYQDLSTQSFFTSATIRKNLLLRPFTVMNGLNNTTSPLGEVKNHALEISFERRFSKGFNLNVGYTMLHARDRDYFYNQFDASPSWRPSNSSRPRRLVASAIWELPFGRGRALARNGVASWLVGGFQLALTYEYQPGALLDWGNLFYSGNLGDIPTDNQTLDHWFDTDGFERVAARQPGTYHRRVFPTRVDGVRADMTNQWNANLLREFRFREGMALQLRLDAINLQNRSQFAAPSASATSTDFGRVRSQTNNLNRFIQIQARIRF
jgi:hypothetical protein